jgi:hypothetical protein
MEKDKEFFRELNVLVQRDYKLLQKLSKTTSVDIISIRYRVILSEDILNEYGLNKDVEFFVDATCDGGKMSYHYKNIKVEANCYYLRPDDYYEVSTLRILQECIKQDTYEPDIKFLERGEE